MKVRNPLLPACLLGLACLGGPVHADNGDNDGRGRAPHVLLISVDGMHASDLQNFVRAHPNSALARLSRHGVYYPNAITSRPSDSFPGLLSMLTGALPKDEGVYYDDSFDRSLLPPVNADALGLNYFSPNSPGTECLYAEAADFDLTRLDGGGGINPDNLPRNPRTLKPVLPHNFGRLNTIFQVAHRAGLRTAWCDKHFAYDIVNGPDAFGPGTNDLYTPEVNANFIVVNGQPQDKTSVGEAAVQGVDGTTSIQNVQANDGLKVRAVLNEIDGRDHTGTTQVGVPSIFGMNFQSVSVGQKLNTEPSPNPGADPDVFPDGTSRVGLPGGYVNGGATPGPLLADSLAFVDASLGKFTAELRRQGLSESTAIILSAKHGQSPIDKRLLRKKVGPNPVKDPSGDDQLGSEGSNNSSPNSLAAFVQTDDVALIWLRPATRLRTALGVLGANFQADGLEALIYGDAMRDQFGDPARDPRTPDIIGVAQTGVIYTKGSKIAEHGGFNPDDVNVALLVSNPGIDGTVVTDRVQTTQIAPTILRLLGLRPSSLLGVQKEGTRALPGFAGDDGE